MKNSRLVPVAFVSPRRFWLLVSVLCSLSSLACTHPAPLPPRALELNRDGAAALAAGDLPTAEARLAVALEYNPRFTEAWVNLGYVELGRGNLELARRNFRKARSLNPDLPAPHHALGLLADERDSAYEAEAYYRSALKVDPAFAPARVNLARRLFERRAFEDAREQFLRLTEIAPENAEGWAGLTECLLRLAREAEADVVLARGRARLGEPAELRVLVARQLLRRGAFDEAHAVLVPLTRDADRNRAALAWSWLALAHVGAGRCGEAREALRQAGTLDNAEPVVNYVKRSLEVTEAAKTPCH